MITVTTTILYCVVYILIAVSAIVLRYKAPNVERPFRLGSGNGLMWIVALLAIFGVAITVIVSLIPPSILPKEQHAGYIAFQVIGTIVSIIIPLIIFKCKKPEWIKK